jgi:hypothetical protein
MERLMAQVTSTRRAAPGRWAAVLAAATVAGLLLLSVGVGTAAAATVDFGAPSISATFGRGIEFRQPVSISGPIRRAELLIQYPRSPGPEVRVVQAESGSSTLRYSLEATDAGLLPNTPVTGRWRIVGQDGSVTVGPLASTRYEDTRFAWQTRQSGIVRVHWYEGGDPFGSRALDIGTRAIDAATRLLGVSESDPIDFFIYASQDAFYAALGPGTRENVGGQANAEIRTLFALITPGEIDLQWVEIVIPHELTHLVFDTAVSNAYHFPPRWLNEGLAVYLSQGYDAGDRGSVERAAASGSLMPLGGLAYQFPTTRDRFSLAYAESVSAVDYMVRAHGEHSLVSLVRSYASGVTDDEAFRAALGVDAAGFDAAWRASLRAREPVVHGPRPAPAGPVPAGWSGGSPVAIATPTEAPAASAAPAGLVGVAVLVVGLFLVVRALRVRDGGSVVGPPATGPGEPS